MRRRRSQERLIDWQLKEDDMYPAETLAIAAMTFFAFPVVGGLLAEGRDAGPTRAAGYP